MALEILGNKRVLSGDIKLDAALSALGEKAAIKYSTRALNKALTVIQKSVKQEAVATLDWTEISPSAIKKAIGKRFKKIKGGKLKGVHEAKVGVNVGSASVKKQLAAAFKKGEGDEGVAWYLHLFALGTKDRFQRMTGKHTGQIEQHDFVKAGYEKAEAAAYAKFVDEARFLVASHNAPRT